ncbi:hypothetical protein [Psychrobacter sp. DAB_AL43B]|uniref:hypothetical protein n=1 Tax=Psychrobacter sp. DAB_AL43B TaxID=1028416 RepID=UPI0009A79376|nr:hypothetical protein [Psychrobacter sp. DAB_AL43B]SLJ83460.1 hypothetical protein DABAL43B_0242 [Psychrobacter sp. DAB_AL43B]
MQKTILSFTIGMSLLFTLSACQPKSEAPEVEAKDSTDQIRQPSVNKTPKPAIADNSAVDAKTCLALSKSMQKVDNTSKIEAIDALQKTLKACLPTASNTEVLNLLKDYQAMYERFLWDDSDINDEEFNNDFFEVMSALEQNEKVPVESLKKMSPRVRYLIGLIQNDADVRVYNLGEGYYAFSHNLTAMADIFTPYLRQDQKAFIQRMAQDNQDTFWSDASVTTSFSELIERTVFWENYIKRYPNGYAIEDAKSLLDLYRYVLFFGSDNTQWTDDAIHELLEPDYRQNLLKLTKRPNSVLAKDAQLFLNFLSLTDSERQSKYPAPDTDEEGYEMSEWQIARYQLNEALQIPSIWGENADNSRDCLNGVFCQDESSD